MAMQKRGSWLALLGFGSAVAGAAFVASRYSPRDAQTGLWYERLEKPAFNPPNAVFPIVWTSLYALMAISAWRIWQAEASPERSRALRLWATQLAANTGWTRFFFGEHRPKRALLDVIYLECLIIAYVQKARKVDLAAAACFLPYAAWVGFAAVLNEEIVRLNPTA